MTYTLQQSSYWPRPIPSLIMRLTSALCSPESILVFDLKTFRSGQVALPALPASKAGGLGDCTREVTTTTNRTTSPVSVPNEAKAGGIPSMYGRNEESTKALDVILGGVQLGGVRALNKGVDRFKMGECPGVISHRSRALYNTTHVHSSFPS